jgi:hypothetical protein
MERPAEAEAPVKCGGLIDCSGGHLQCFSSGLALFLLHLTSKNRDTKYVKHAPVLVQYSEVSAKSLKLGQG